MKLLLIRHGQSVGNLEGRMQGHMDSPLSDLGRDQARILAQRLLREQHEIAAIYSSDLLRASETAEILAASLNLPVALDSRLREFDIGILNGVIWRELEFLHPELWHGFNHSPDWVEVPEAESNEAFHNRLSAALAYIRAKHEDGETLAIVSHGGSLGMLLAGLLGIDYRKPTPFRFGNTSLNVVEFNHRGPVLTLMNDTHHLDDNATEGWLSIR